MDFAVPNKNWLAIWNLNRVKGKQKVLWIYCPLEAMASCSNDYFCWCHLFQASLSFFCYCKVIFSWLPFLSSKQLFAYKCILRITVKIMKSPSNIPQMQKSKQVYYRQWVVLPIRISSVRVVHTCGLLALLLIGVWESIMKNKVRMTRRDSTANMGYFTLVRKWNSKYWFGDSSLLCGSMCEWFCKGYWCPAHCK